MSKHITLNGVQIGVIDYCIGDIVMNDNGTIIGKCTGFAHDDTCIKIDGKCWGGKYYFHRAEETIDINFVVEPL